MWKIDGIKSLLLLCLLLVFSLPCGYSQDAQQPESQLTILSWNIRQELQNLKIESEIMKNDLDNMIALLAERSNDLRLPEEERIESQTELNGLYTSLRSMSENYSESLARIILLEQTIRKQRVIIIVAILLALYRLISNIIQTILMFKRRQFSLRNLLKIWL